MGTKIFLTVLEAIDVGNFDPFVSVAKEESGVLHVMLRWPSYSIRIPMSSGAMLA